MRLFIGIQPPFEIAKECLRRCQSLRESEWRLVHPEKFHLTLHFLGEMDASAIPAISSALIAASLHVRPFLLQLSQHGSFPRDDRARLVWASVHPSSHPLLQRLYDEIRNFLQVEGISWTEQHRAFQPHLTLARSRRPRLVDFRGHDFEDLSFEVKDVQLYQSKEGRYEMLFSFPLAK